MEKSKTLSTAVKSTLNPNAGTVAELRLFAKASHKASLAVVKASTILVKAAIKGRDQFTDSVDVFYAEIRKDVGGLATAIAAERNKAGTEFVVPNSLMVQVSQVLRAIKYGVDLGTLSDPKGMGEIRNATTAAKEAEEGAAATAAEALLTGDDAVRLALSKALHEAIDTIATAEGPKLEAFRTATEDYCAAMLEIVDQYKAEAETATESDDDAANEIAEAAEAAPVQSKPKRSRRAA